MKKPSEFQRALDPSGHIYRGAVKLAAFLERAFPEDDVLLDRLIVAKSVGMIAGQRGGGKTWLVILICYAVAGGKNLSPWGHGKKRRVVYLDGEMRAASLQNRLELIHEFNGDPESRECVEENLLIISRDYMGSTIGSIDTEEGQACIDALLPPDVAMIVIDNLSAWTSGGREDSQSWATIKNWLIKKRVKGIAVLLVHHAGKNGQQRGTSAHEDLLDFSILLSPLPSDPDKKDTRFSVEHTKLRDYVPELRQPHEFSIWFEDGKLRFESAPTGFNSALNVAEMAKLHDEGMSMEAIGDQFGVSKSTVSRSLRKYREQMQSIIEATDD